MRLEMEVDCYMATRAEKDNQIKQTMFYIPKMQGNLINEDEPTVELIVNFPKGYDAFYKWDEKDKKWKSGETKTHPELTIPVPLLSEHVVYRLKDY